MIIAQAYRFRVKSARNKKSYHDILIRGDQTFEMLHKIICQAFDDEEDRFYQFIVKTIKQKPEEAEGAVESEASPALFEAEYEESKISNPCCFGGVSGEKKRLDDENGLNAAITEIQQFQFELDQKFKYLLDHDGDWNFENCWKYKIQVTKILTVEKDKNYPQIIKK
ncbi:MAG: hypothetical protein WCS73_06905 [Lentisphaeria bacterium]